MVNFNLFDSAYDDGQHSPRTIYDQVMTADQALDVLEHLAGWRQIPLPYVALLAATPSDLPGIAEQCNRVLETPSQAPALPEPTGKPAIFGLLTEAPMFERKLGTFGPAT